MATAVRTATSEETVETETVQATSTPTLVLKLRKPDTRHRVRWTEETVDNEHLGKKSSKCCCIYEKPRIFGESSSDSDSSDSDDNAYEKKTKKERRKKKREKHNHDCSEHEKSISDVNPSTST